MPRRVAKRLLRGSALIQRTQMIPLPISPKIIEKKNNRAVFEIEPLYPGYGITIGNSLRRVLLSSLPGAAVTQMKIEGVPHEFSTIPGVLEDTVSIMLNLKQMRFKIHSNEPQKATLKVKGKNKVLASDFKYPSQVELVNKSCHIATLTSNSAKLDIEIQIEKGIGFVSRDARKKKESEIGAIALDAIFSPIRKISYKVKNIRVGERTDFDNLTLEIETDGTTTPEEAFSYAVEVLLQHFSLFSKWSEKSKAPEKQSKSKEDKRLKTQEDLTKTKVEDLKISQRTINILLKNNIKSVGGILRKDEKSLLDLEGMGQKGINEIKKALKKLNLEFTQ